MATLQSAGISISVIDESFYATAGLGTIPLFIIATETNKVSPVLGAGIAPATVPKQAGKLFLATSQRDLIQNFGNPIFHSLEGTPLHGHELNEYGLWSAYSYLGINNQAYILRADIDTSQLQASVTAPVGPPVSGTYWFDTKTTLWGLFRANGSTTPGHAWVNVIPKVATATDVDINDVPNTGYGSDGDLAVVPVDASNYIYEKVSGTWYAIGSDDWKIAHPTKVTGTTVSATLVHNNTFTINGVTVTVTTSPYHIDNIVTDINGASIPNITASQALNNALVITNDIGGDVVLAAGTGTPLTTLGLAVGTHKGVSVARTNGPSYPDGSSAGSFWIKGSKSNKGANWSVKYYNGTIGQWTTFTAPFYPFTQGLLDGNTAKDATALASIIAPNTGALYVGYDSSIAGTATSGTFTPGDSFTINGVTVNITTSPYNFTTLLSDIATAAVPNITARVATNGALVLVSTNGLSITLANGTGTPLATLGLLAQTYSFGGDQQIRRWSGSAWLALTYEADSTAPSTAPAAGTYWYDANFRVDIMVGNGQNWKGYAHRYPSTDPNGPQISGSAPTTQSDGTTSLVDNDLWIDSSDLENYPSIYRWSTSDLTWGLIDNTDQTSPFGCIFADARSDSGPTFTGILNGGTYTYSSTVEADMALSDYCDPDAPDPRTHPDGMLLFNTRYSTYNVKVWQPNYFLAGSFDPNTDFTTTSYNVGDDITFTFPPLSSAGTWVTASGNKIDGSPYMGRKSQRVMLVRAMASTILTNQEIRSEIVFYNLMAAPGYPELIPEFVTLNTDQKDIAFCVADTPIRLKPEGIDIQNWANNAANVEADGEDGIVTANKYVGVYYPWGLSVNLDGTEIMVPPSAIALVTMAYNDQVAYPWYAPAGFNRGLVSNATSVGYLSSEGEYTPTILNNGQRDVLYINKINPIAYIPHRGLVVYGQKTLSPVASALDRINVARLINYIAYNLDIIMKPFLFEPNVLITRATAKSTAERFFNQLVGLNGIYDFAVVCDSTNNTPDRIARNELWIDCAIRPTITVEFIYVPVRILSTQAITG
jgi:Phage tail sheath C-terminal domain